MRFVSAQFEAQLTDGHWLRHAGHANAMAQRLAKQITGFAGAALLHPVEANEIFVMLPEPAIGRLEAEGFLFYRWDAGAEPCIRLVTAFDTQESAIEGFVEALRQAI
jgi:threonine aldolase